MPKYKRYQDYVIKDGALIGEFEEMYRDFNDPWEQKVRERSALEKKLTLEIIKQKEFKRILEFGCGLGYFTDQLRSISGNALGLDISETAIKKAKESYPKTDFLVGDILDFDVIRKYKPDCIVFAEITWYVLEKLDVFRKFIAAELPGVGFIHLLMTYPKEEQKYGKEYFANISEIIEYWKEVDVQDWGEFSRKEYNGGKRTFCFGYIGEN